MATITLFNRVLERDGLEAAARYAAAAQFGLGIETARRLARKAKSAPMRKGKTQRDRENGVTARWRENAEKRREENR